MSSLKDQLLKAGMVDAKKAKQVEKEKRKHAKQVKKGLAEPDNQAKLAAEKSKAAQLAKTQQANLQQQHAAQEKAIAAQIKQLIESNRIDHQQGDIGYQFVDGKTIKRIYVDGIQQRQLEKGLIAIVSNGKNYELVPASVADKISQRNSNIVMVLNDKKTSDADIIDEDDYYVDYKVPDDLMW